MAESSTDDKSDGGQQASDSLVHSPTAIAAASHKICPKRHAIENILLIWLDSSIDPSTDDYGDILARLQSIVSDIYIYNNADDCVDFLTEIKDEKVFMVVKGAAEQHVASLIHDVPQLEAIYVFCDNESNRQEWVGVSSKVNDMHTHIASIYEVLRQAVEQYDRNSIAISFVKVDEHLTTQKLDQLEPSFMYTQIFKEILLDTEYSGRSFNDFIKFCQKSYENNPYQLKTIADFDRDYYRKSAIWCYTALPFIYSVLNRGLRLLEADTILNMAFFIRDLHHEIKQRHQNQIKSYNGKPFIVYRGQALSSSDFAKLMEIKDGLISFNNFLSTSRNRDAAFLLADSNAEASGMVGVLFEMTIDPSISSTPFATIDDISQFQSEEEILFSMHSVFRIKTILKTDNSRSVYHVDLTLTADNDRQLHTLTEYIREQTKASTGVQRIGHLLTKIGEYDKAEQCYTELIAQTSDPQQKALFHNNLAYTKYKQGDFENALAIDKEIIEYLKASPSPDASTLAAAYNNIGGVYLNTGEHSKALSSYNEALAIRQKLLSPDHIDIGQSYNNIAAVYRSLGELSNALSLYEKGLDVFQRTLPSSHPDLAASYNNLGELCDSMGEYSKALSYYNKALAICNRSLPPDHLDFAQSHNSIGILYQRTGCYQDALLSYEEARRIREKNLPPNHTDIAQSYNSIGGLFASIGQYQEALQYYQRAIEIFEQHLPSSRLYLATSYNNIGGVYNNLEVYSDALLFFTRGLEIEESILPSSHPSLATSYNNIGLVHYKTRKYSAALSFHKKALEIRENVLSVNHPDLAQSYQNIGGVYKQMMIYPEALSYHKKAIEILEETVPATHPDLANAYNNIGLLYKNMNEFSQALTFYRKALRICEESFPPNYPILANSYNNIGVAHYSMGETREALSFLQRALRIFQILLPANHPTVQAVRHNIENIRQGL